MSRKYFHYFAFFIIIVVFSCKSKTELYLERGLDILSNVKEIEFNIYQDVIINEIGIIRDQKEGIKTLVFKLDNNTNKNAFNNNSIIGVRVWIIDENNNERKENWDFKPKLIKSKGHKYILKKIKVKEDRIKKMKICDYQNIDGKKQKIGSSILLNKIYTYND